PVSLHIVYPRRPAKSVECKAKRLKSALAVRTASRDRSSNHLENHCMSYDVPLKPASLPKRLRNFVREAISDNETDFTVGPIGRALGLLAIPMMLEMSMEAIFALADIIFVSRLGTNAVAAVGLTEALVTVLYAVAIGLGMGVTAMIS